MAQDGAVAAAVSALEGSIGTLTDVTDSIKSRSALKVIIELENCTEMTLAHPLVYMSTGQVLDPPQPTIPVKHKAAFSFCKYDTLLKAVFGICTYDVCDSKAPQKPLCRMAVLFSVPYYRMSYSNEFALGIIPPDTPCDDKLLDDFYSGNSSDANLVKANGSELSFSGKGYTIYGTMAQTADAIIKVEFRTTTTEKK